MFGKKEIHNAVMSVVLKKIEEAQARHDERVEIAKNRVASDIAKIHEKFELEKQLSIDTEVKSILGKVI